MYANLHRHIPNIDDLVGRLNKIGFSFTKTADNRWAFTTQDNQRQRYFEPGVIYRTIDAVIKALDGYQLLELLRERQPSQTKLGADEVRYFPGIINGNAVDAAHRPRIQNTEGAPVNDAPASNAPASGAPAPGN